MKHLWCVSCRAVNEAPKQATNKHITSETAREIYSHVVIKQQVWSQLSDESAFLCQFRKALLIASQFAYQSTRIHR